MFRLALALVFALDGGPSADAGPPPAPERFTWKHDKGEWMNDAGLTDILLVRVGETAEVKFPFAIVLMQCDEPLLTLDATEETLLLKGAKAGQTTCGFWFDRRAWPHRTMQVTVTK
jgi:hypothetical protein